MPNVELTTAERTELLRRLVAGELPDSRGRFGPFGGRYAPETLITALERLAEGVQRYLRDPAYQSELAAELKDWVGRPTALSHAPTLSRRWGVEVYFKREDLAHTGAHKINNALGQALLARRLGAKRVIAETGAGQHGVATAAACARVGIPCIVYMGAVDVLRQAPNVERMVQFGAEVVPVKTGDKTLRAAIDEAFRDWVSDPAGSYYLLGSALGPHPYPLLVRELQAVIGREARAQFIERTGGLPDAAFACVGGGSNAIGLFHPLAGDASVALIGVEAGGRSNKLGDNAATLATGRPGVLHGTYSLLCRMITARCRRRIRCRLVSTIRALVPSMRCCRPSAAPPTPAPPTMRRSRRCASAVPARASCRPSSPRMRWLVQSAGRWPIRAKRS
jgi:tryptophan synthase beta chain